MFRYKLRMLMILLAVGPPLLVGLWLLVSAVIERREAARPRNSVQVIVTPICIRASAGLSVFPISGLSGDDQ